jgi:SAM-dependent methyltransferase
VTAVDLAEPGCRFARDAARRPDLFTHVCARSDGRPLRPGDRCFAEERLRQARTIPPVFDGDDYQSRFDRLAADGVDVHGEASLVASFAPCTVLDAGCGTGRVATELHRRGVTVVGVDVDRSMLATARRLGPDVEWIEDDLATFDLGPARRAYFDLAVMAGNVVLFVRPGTQADVVARVARHVRPDGLVVAGFQLQRGGYTLAEYHAHCAAAGLTLVDRWSTWDRAPFDAGDDYAVSVHRRTAATAPAT